MKLIYFNGKGRAEPARLILAQAGVDYEDHRIEFADWPALKPSRRICSRVAVGGGIYFLCFVTDYPFSIVLYF